VDVYSKKESDTKSEFFPGLAADNLRDMIVQEKESKKRRVVPIKEIG
jgi:hypothetical protein